MRMGQVIEKCTNGDEDNLNYYVCMVHHGKCENKLSDVIIRLPVSGILLLRLIL